MTERIELPEGVTFNAPEEGYVEFELPFEVTTEWKCDKCEVHFQSFLLGHSGRYQGQVRTLGSNAITWQGPLPKDKTKAEKLLQESLQKKVDFHKERH